MNQLKVLLGLFKEKKIILAIKKFFRSPESFINYFKFSKEKDFKPILNYAPVNATLTITNQCNSNCKMCVRNSNLFNEHFSAKEEMDFEKFKIILKKINKITSIYFAGVGEPLLNQDLFKMMDWANKKGKLVGLYTNGILLTEENIEKIIKSKINIINISLYGFDADDFTATTQLDKKVFYQVIENIKNLISEKKKKKSKTSIHISYVCSRDKIDNMKKMVKLINTIKPDKLVFANLFLSEIHNKENLKKIFFNSDQALKEEFEELQKISEVKMTLPLLITDKPNKGCNYCRSYVHIDTEGNVSPCCKLPPNKKYGNVHQKDYYNNKFFINFRTIIINDPSIYCKFCPLLYRD